jgi:hypothetical protein
MLESLHQAEASYTLAGERPRHNNKEQNIVVYGGKAKCRLHRMLLKIGSLLA